MRAIIHFSAFDQTGDEDYIVKEVAIVSPDANTMQNWVFQAPFDPSELPLTIQLDNDYLATHVFGIDWSDGDVSYSELQRILVKYTKCIDTLYTHGERRQRYLQQLLGRTVVNLEDVQCPKAIQLLFPASHCAHYQHQFPTFRCALYEAQCYAKYLQYHDLAQYISHDPPCVYNPSPITPSSSVRTVHDDDDDECTST